MDIYIKIGTLSAKRMHVVRLRKAPKVGAIFKVKPIGSNQYVRPEGVYIHEIRDIDGEPLYIAERM